MSTTLHPNSVSPLSRATTATATRDVESATVAEQLGVGIGHINAQIPVTRGVSTLAGHRDIARTGGTHLRTRLKHNSSDIRCGSRPHPGAGDRESTIHR